jgi:hypothetical protein
MNESQKNELREVRGYLTDLGGSFLDIARMVVECAFLASAPAAAMVLLMLAAYMEHPPLGQPVALTPNTGHAIENGFWLAWSLWVVVLFGARLLFAKWWWVKLNERLNATEEKK